MLACYDSYQSRTIGAGSATCSHSHLPNRDVSEAAARFSPDVGVDQAGAARLLQAVRRNGELARLDLRRNELPPKVVKMLAKQARGFRKESDDDVPLELLLEPQEKSEQAGQ